ncbi:zinc-binding alcohol dehydrogenase family protein [Chitinivorax sp. B]|uniref:zinc-binding alcohol dehydrogenase family protein n=1 Tax=Chitinivorax sp. B TaxID=2502235 RepID=UPI0010F4965D|nr:zinc-binding alcohol dehydrogenase family protein [Chitinivorax sp. B]
MKAVGLYRYLPIDHPEALLDVALPDPIPGPHDVLVAIRAIAANPVDYKVRAPKDHVEAMPKVLGWDAAGVVQAVGSAVSLFKPGDEVYYAGDLTRQGSNAELQLVDERIIGRKPVSLSFEQAAALPLTTITAWEVLFDRLGIAQSAEANRGRSILILGGAGGVGSIAIQLAKRVAGLQVVATASRPDSAAWCRDFGADETVNHFADMPAQFRERGLPAPDYILCLSDTDLHFAAMAELIKPQGKIASIVETTQPVALNLLKGKSASFHWELMFTRSLHQTDDMIEQHRLLNQVADLIDKGTLRTTLGEVIRPINAANLKLAHAKLEAGRAIGKIVLSGF